MVAAPVAALWVPRDISCARRQHKKSPAHAGARKGNDNIELPTRDGARVPLRSLPIKSHMCGTRFPLASPLNASPRKFGGHFVYEMEQVKNQPRCLCRSNLKGHYSYDQNNPVNTSVRRALDGTTDRQRTTAFVVAALIVAVIVIAGVTSYSISNSLLTTATTTYSPIVDDFKSLETSRPAPTLPSTTGQGGTQ